MLLEVVVMRALQVCPAYHDVPPVLSCVCGADVSCPTSGANSLPAGLDGARANSQASEVESMLESFKIKGSRWSRCPFCAHDNDSTETPDMFRCPLSKTPLTDPVVACDGYTYDKRAILDWFDKGNRTSPLTGAVLKSTATLPNHLIRSAVREWADWKARMKQNSDSGIHHVGHTHQ